MIWTRLAASTCPFFDKRKIRRINLVLQKLTTHASGLLAGRRARVTNNALRREDCRTRAVGTNGVALVEVLDQKTCATMHIRKTFLTPSTG
jgi:hypothetical protein